MNNNNKLVPMPGLDINHYKGYVIEWVESQDAYRVYKRERPEETIGYSDSIREAQCNIDEYLNKPVSPFESVDSYLSVFAN